MPAPLPTLNDSATVLTPIRNLLLAILVLGLLGTGAELLLLGHTEQPLQWVPLCLILGSLLVLAWQAADRRPASLRVFQGTMILFLASGVAGMLLHYRGSVEFKLESTPSLSGMQLFWEAIQSQAPPVLAPGAMIQMGLVGLAYSYRHPRLGVSTDERIFQHRSRT